jgi:hypothetical protein
MIHIVEEIKLWLLLGNRMVMTSLLATVGQTYPRKRIVSFIYLLLFYNLLKIHKESN